MNHEKARILLSQAEAFLVKSHAQLEDDYDVDMQEFETIVQEFCAEIAKMPREDAQIYERNLQTLGQALEAFSGVLEVKRDTMKQKIHALNATSKAHSAYQNQGSQ